MVQNVFRLLGDEDSQFPVTDDESSASEMKQTVDGEISNSPFGVSAVYPTQSGESAVYQTQSGVSSVYPTQSGSSASYPPATKSAHGAVSQIQLCDSIALSPEPGVSGVYSKKFRVEIIDTQPRFLSTKTVNGVRKRHEQPALNATVPKRKIIPEGFLFFRFYRPSGRFPTEFYNFIGKRIRWFLCGH